VTTFNLNAEGLILYRLLTCRVNEKDAKFGFIYEKSGQQLQQVDSYQWHRVL
jgi:hypothetical protein